MEVTEAPDVRDGTGDADVGTPLDLGDPPAAVPPAASGGPPVAPAVPETPFDSTVPVDTTGPVDPVEDASVDGTAPPVAGAGALVPAGPTVETAAVDTADDEGGVTTVGVPEVDDEQPATTSVTASTTPASTADERRPVTNTTLLCQQYRRSDCRPQQPGEVVPPQRPNRAGLPPESGRRLVPGGTVSRCTGPA